MIDMKKIIFCILLLLMTSTAFGADPKSILGVWKTDRGESQVEIFMCGNKFCGKIIWLRNPMRIGNEEIKAPIFDRKNPEPSLRSRPVLGLQILKGFTAEGENIWGDGTCYDPKSGNTYKGKIHMTEPDKLILRGYILIPFFGRNSVWTR